MNASLSHFVECYELMREICKFRRIIQRISKEDWSFYYILTYPKPGESLDKYNKKYCGKGIEIINYFKIQKKICNICNTFNFDANNNFSEKIEDHQEYLTHPKLFGGGVYVVSHSFVIKSDRNFTVSAGVEFDISNNVENLNIETRLIYNGDPHSTLCQEFDKLGDEYLVSFKYSSLKYFLSKIEKISIKDMLHQKISKYEKELRFDDYYNLSRSELPLLREEYNIPPPRRKVSLSRYFTFLWNKLQLLKREYNHHQLN